MTSYRFPTGAINVTILRSQDHNFVMFDSKIDYDKEMLLQNYQQTRISIYLKAKCSTQIQRESMR